MADVTIIIDDEFQSYITPITDEEYVQLEANLLAEGCRDALVTWQGILIDGHNRYEICQNHGIPFDTVCLNIPDREAALKWIIDNQIGRRNLTPEAMAYYRGKRYAAEKETHGGAREASGKSCHLKTSERLAKEHGVSERTIRNNAVFAMQVDELQDRLGGDTRQKLLAHDAGLSRQMVAEISKMSDEDAARAMQSKASPHRVLGYSGEYEIYSPAEIIEMAREVMGHIDLDPASSPQANQTVKAENYFTKEDDGLSQEWSGNVWLNPPYSRGVIDQWVDKLLAELECRRVRQAILLTNNSSDTEWCHKAHNASLLRCETSGRLKFQRTDDKDGSSNTVGQFIFYFGSNDEKFIEVFARVGAITKQVAPYRGDAIK